MKIVLSILIAAGVFLISRAALCEEVGLLDRSAAASVRDHVEADLTGAID